MKPAHSFAIVLLLSWPAFAAGPAMPVATIGTVPVTQDDLNRAVGAKLNRILTDEYNLRRGVLDELIAEKLIDAEAARRHLTAEELLKREVDDKVVAPRPEDIEPVYEGVADRYAGMSKEQALAQIAEGMRRSRSFARWTDFVKDLRDAKRP